MVGKKKRGGKGREGKGRGENHVHIVSIFSQSQYLEVGPFLFTPFLLLDRVLTEVSLVSKTKLSKAYAINKANNLLNSIFIFMLSDYQFFYNSHFTDANHYNRLSSWTLKTSLTGTTEMTRPGLNVPENK